MQGNIDNMMMQQPALQTNPNATVVDLKPLTPEFQAQLRQTVAQMLQHNPSHIGLAEKAMKRLMQDQKNWVAVFNEEPILITLYRSNHHIFSTWHPLINAFVNKPGGEKGQEILSEANASLANTLQASQAAQRSSLQLNQTKT